MNNIPVFDIKKISKKYNKLNMLKLKFLSYISISNLSKKNQLHSDKNEPYVFIEKGVHLGIYNDCGTLSNLIISSIDKVVISTREPEDKMRKLFSLNQDYLNKQFMLFGLPFEFTINKIDSFMLPIRFFNSKYTINNEQSSFVLYVKNKDYDIRIFGHFIHV